MLQGQIVKLKAGVYMVDTKDKVWHTRARGVFRKDEISPCVGDIVDIEPILGDSHHDDIATITKVYPRKNSLVRPPVANIDHGVVVASTVAPFPNYMVLDTLLAILESYDIHTVIAVTKPDLAAPDQLANLYREVGYNVFIINNETGDGGKELEQYLGKSLCVFAGNSGTGKSSLLNTLQPTLDLEVGETSKKLGRGRHTTRHVEIFTLDSGLRIADTPGFSSMDLEQSADITIDFLDQCFIEFLPYITTCRFNNCKHLTEAGCNIKRAVESGKINTQRYENYKQLYNELKDVKDWERR